MAQPEDVVLEVGCQLNNTTRLIAAKAAAVVGVDLARKLGSKGGGGSEAGLSNVALHIQDVWDLRVLQEAVLNAPGGGRIDLLVIDPTTVLGHDLLFEILALVRALQRLFRPRAALIKSKALCGLQQVVHAHLHVLYD